MAPVHAVPRPLSRTGLEQNHQQQPRRSERLRAKQRLDQRLKTKEAPQIPLATSSSAKTPPDQASTVRHRHLGQKRDVSHGPEHQAGPGGTTPRLCHNKGEPNRKRLPLSSAIEGSSAPGPASEIEKWFGTLHYWIQEGTWPAEYFEQESDMVLTRRTLNSSSCAQPLKTGTESRNQWKGPAVRSSIYDRMLDSVRIYQTPSTDPNLRVSELDVELIHTLLGTEQPVPCDSLFDDCLFEKTMEAIATRNEARVIKEISQLFTPSPEQLARRGATHLEPLIENVDESWSNCIPLLKAHRPRPDFSVGLKPTALTPHEIEKLGPFIGEWSTWSSVVATDRMYFPFLTAEAKCGNEALAVADRQNAHSASIAVNAVVRLYRAVSRERELHRRILAFSLSHDNRTVRISGHYPVINGPDTAFYRHIVHNFDVGVLMGKEKWTAYRFTKNVYDIFFPLHLERIRAAIAGLPEPDVFSATSLSRLSVVEANLGPSTLDSAKVVSDEDFSSDTAKPALKRRKGKKAVE